MELEMPATSEAMTLALRQAMASVINSVSLAESGRKRGVLYRRIHQADFMLTRGIAYLDEVEGRGENQTPDDVNFARWESLLKDYCAAVDLTRTPE